MKVELWFRGKPITQKEVMPNDLQTQTYSAVAGEGASAQTRPECFCQKRYGHPNHTTHCPHYEEEK